MRKGYLLFCLAFFAPLVVTAAGGSGWPLTESPSNVRDKYSLQRGAKYYMNYCQGCHSLKYMRYKRMAKDIGLTDRDGEILDVLVRENLMFNTDKIGNTIETSMRASDAKVWFGNPAPDLTLTARRRGIDWLYTYLRSFYSDSTKQWGVNNAVFPDVGMPHVLADLQGTKKPVFKTVTKTVDGKIQELEVLDRLELVKEGKLSPLEYDRMVADIVNFLAYVGEPMKLYRQRVGIAVICFLLIFGFMAYLLKREFWKDVH